MKIGSTTAVFFYLAVAMFWQTNAAFACSCIVMPRAEVYQGSDVVVVGRVVDVKVVGELKHARVEVSKTIKGAKPSSSIIEFVTKLDSSQCGYRFKVRDKQLTIAANSQANGTPFVDNCMMYSLKVAARKDRRLARAKAIEEAQKPAKTKNTGIAQKVAKIKKQADANKSDDKIVTVSCLAESKTGSAACNAICPKGRTVLSCAQNVGNFASDDTCTSMSHMFSGPAGGNYGRLGAQPNDRCRVSATCSDRKQKLSAQAWASCVRP